jgi:hypothetical protein
VIGEGADTRRDVGARRKRQVHLERGQVEFLHHLDNLANFNFCFHQRFRQQPDPTAFNTMLRIIAKEFTLIEGGANSWLSRNAFKRTQARLTE